MKGQRGKDEQDRKEWEGPLSGDYRVTKKLHVPTPGSTYRCNRL
jgi:hypothetical protein